MAALCNRAGHYSVALWFLLLSFFFLFLFFPRLISAVTDACLPYFDTWCGPSANLECRSEMCCAWLAGNEGPKKSPKIRHLGTIEQLCRPISSQLRHVSTIGKKLANQQYLLQMSSQYGELGPLAAEIGPVVWGTQCQFQRVSRLGSITARHSSSRRQPNFAATPVFGRATITLGICPHSSYGRPM